MRGVVNSGRDRGKHSAVDLQWRTGFEGHAKLRSGCHIREEFLSFGPVLAVGGERVQHALPVAIFVGFAVLPVEKEAGWMEVVNHHVVVVATAVSFVTVKHVHGEVVGQCGVATWTDVS